jgi:lysophospholipase L1-like esterase
MNTNLDYKKPISALVFILISAILLIFSAFSPILPVTAQTNDSIGKVQTEKKLFNIVVVGDSLAVGYERGHTADSKPFGVGEQIYEQALFQGYRAEYVNYGINGLTSSGLLRWLDAAQNGTAITTDYVQAGLKDQRANQLISNATQLKQDIAEADLIMLAIGGNDFLKILSQLDLQKQWSEWSLTERDELQATLSTTTSQYIEQLSSILSTIHKLNEDAVVVTQNQYLPLPKIKFNGVEEYKGVEEALAKILDAEKVLLNSKFDELLDTLFKQGMNIRAIDASGAIESYAIGLTDIVHKDPHPNAVGYKKLSQYYSQLIWGEYRAVQPREEGVPLSVVVNGKEVISKYPTKLKNGRTYLVLRDITDAMGAKVTWSNQTQTATITMDNRVVEFTIGAKTYKVNGQSYTLNADPAFLDKVNGESKTYIPVAALSEGLDFFVVYHAPTKTVYVNK